MLKVVTTVLTFLPRKVLAAIGKVLIEEAEIPDRENDFYW